MINEQYTLPNGLKVIHIQTDSPISYCGFGIKSATRDEHSNQHGMAHFVEHMLFKGTHSRNSNQIINYLEYEGGELNAYTSKEETVVYSVIINKAASKAIDLLCDVVYNSTFPQKELEKEAVVIVDEINSYKDSPSELIFDDFENLIFNDHELGHHILGEEQEILEYTNQDLRTFHEEHYTNENMIFFYFGGLEVPKVRKMLEKQSKTTSQGKPVKIINKPIFAEGERKEIEMDTNQTHLVIGGPALSHYDNNRMALYLLNNIMGGTGMNSRLNLSLRERRGLVYNVESSLTPYTDCGLFTIYLGCDPKNEKRCESLVHKELARIREQELTSIQLHRAKKQLFGQLAIANENRESLSLGIAKSFMYHGRFDSLEEVYRKIDAVTTQSLLEMANITYDPQKLFTLVYR